MGVGRTVLGVVLLAGLAAAQEQIPLPVRKSTILRKGGVTYFVEGRKKIPRGCEISVQKDVYIVGRGGNAVIEVEGSLQIHGVSTREVIVSDVWIEPSRHCEDIHLDMVIFRKGGGVRSASQTRARGKLFLENVVFSAKTDLDVAMESGRIDLSSVGCYEPARITGIVPEGKNYSPLIVNIRGCARHEPPNGFEGGLFVTNAKDATVRINYMAGAMSVFTDCLTLTFDGNKVLSKELYFRQSKPGRFKKTKLQKSDIYSGKLILSAPEGRKETVLIDKCWFRGMREKEVRARVLEERNNVRAKFGKVKERPLELAGPLER